jgi:hypothetical protein
MKSMSIPYLFRLLIRFVFSFFIVWIVFGCSPFKTINSSYQQNVPEIDALLRDWNAEFISYDKENLHFAVSNDSNNLYFALRTKNASLQRKIMTFGLKVWIDTTGRGKKQLGIHYPLPVKLKIPSGEDKKPEETRKPPKDLSYSKSERLNKIGLIGFENNEELITKLSNPDVKVEVKTVGSDYLAYELKVPFEKLSFQPDTSKPISIGFETGYLERKNRPYDDMSRRNRGGIYGGMYGGYTRNSPYSTSRPVSDIMTSTNLWLKEVYLHFNQK